MINSTLAITTPATDLSLLNAAELRVAAGLGAGDSSKDDALAAIELEAREWIADLCGVTAADDGSYPPTILRETLTETFISGGCDYRALPLILSRVPAIVSTITVDDVALVAGDDYRTEGGLLYRRSGSSDIVWSGTEIAVEYQGGLASVPATVKGLVGEFVRIKLSQQTPGRDPLVRSETNDGVSSFTYFDRAGSGTTFDDYARDRLSRYSMRRWCV